MATGYPEAEQFLKGLPFPGARAYKHVKALEALLGATYRQGFAAGRITQDFDEGRAVEHLVSNMWSRLIKRVR